jgi:hypothetical protein
MKEINIESLGQTNECYYCGGTGIIDLTIEGSSNSPLPDYEICEHCEE